MLHVGNLQPAAVGNSPVPLGRERARRPALAYLLLLLFILLFYGNVVAVFPGLEPVRPTQVVALAALAVFFFELTLSRRSVWIPSPEGYLMLLFLGAAGLSCVDAVWPRLAAESLADLAKMGVVYFLIVNTVDDERRVSGMFWTMAVGGLFPALGTLHLYANGIVEEERGAWIGTFGNPNDLAISLAVLVPIAFAAGARRSIPLRLLSYAILATYLAAIWVTFSRGGTLGLFAALLVMALRHRGTAGRFLAAGLLAASLVFVAHYWSRDEGFADLTEDETFNSRIETMKAGIAMFADRPLLGVGINCSATAWPLYAPGLTVGTWLHNHNTFTQVLSETGLLGAVPYALLIACSLWSLSRARRGPAGRYAPAVEASIWGFLVCGLSAGLVLSWFPFLLLGLAAAVSRMKPL
jgi:O-antigen ligase